MDRNRTLLIDVGNLLFFEYKQEDSDSYEEKNRIITEAMNMMAYDGLNLSFNDISPATRFLEERCRNAKFPVVSANTTIKQLCTNAPVQKYIIKEINGIRIGITGIMANTGHEGMLDPRFHIEEPAAALKAIIPDLAAQTDFIILMSGLNGKDTYELLAGIPDIDLGLCIESIRVPVPVRTQADADKGKTPLIMNITTRGIELGILNIEKADDGRVYIPDGEILLLDQTVPSDEKMLDLLKQFDAWEAEQALKEKAALEEEKKQKRHQELLNNLELSPEEYFNRINQTPAETEE